MSSLNNLLAPTFLREFGGLRVRARRYWETIRWFLSEFFRFDRRRYLIVIYLAFVGRAVQAAALAVLFLVAHSIENDTTVTALGLSMHFRDPNHLIVGVAVSGVLLLLGAVLIYHGKQVLVEAATDFASMCGREVLLTRRTYTSPLRPLPADPLSPAVRREVNAAFILSRTAMTILSAISPLTVLLFAILGLLYLSPTTLMGLLLVVLPASVFLYLINLRAVQNQRALTRAAGRRRRTSLRLAMQVAQDNRSAEILRGPVEARFAEPGMTDALDRFKFRLMATTRAEYVANCIIAIAVTALVAYLGFAALQGQASWTVLLSIIIALRFVLVSLRGVVVSVTQYARFHPTLRSLFELMTHIAPAADLGAKSITLKSTWRPEATAALDKATLECGEPLAFVSQLELSRYTLFAFARDICQSSRRVSARRMVASAIPVIDMDQPVAPFRLADVAAELRIRDATDRYARLQQIWPQLPAVDAAIGADEFAGMGRADRAAVLLAAAALSDADVLFIDSDLLRAVAPEPRHQYLSAVQDRFVVIVYRGDDVRVCDFGEALAMVANGTGGVLVATADDVRKNARPIRKALKRMAESQDGLEVDELDEEP